MYMIFTNNLYVMKLLAYFFGTFTTCKIAENCFRTITEMCINFAPIFARKQQIFVPVVFSVCMHFEWTMHAQLQCIMTLYVQIYSLSVLFHRNNLRCKPNVVLHKQS